MNAPHVQHTIVDVQNSAVEPHFQSSVVYKAHQEVALSIFQTDEPDLDVSGVTFSNYDPQIITTPGGTILSVLKLVPYICEEIESHNEPEPNQPNLVCGQKDTFTAANFTTKLTPSLNSSFVH